MNGAESVFRRKELLWTLAVRDIRVRYKQSYLGIAWAVIQPFTLMVIFTFVFGKLAKIDTADIPYPIFAYAALVPWTFFASALGTAIPSVVQNASIVKKVYFPREILPLSTVISSLMDFAIAFVVLLGMMVWFGAPFAWTMVFLPVLLLLTIMIAMAIALFASAVNVYYRDIRYAVPLLLQLWMYATPVAYPLQLLKDNGYAWVYYANPMGPVIESFRRILVHGTLPDFPGLAISAGIAIVILIPAYWFFKRVEMNFADIV